VKYSVKAESAQRAEFHGVKNMEKIICHDCGQELKNGAEYMAYVVGGETFVKCAACHQKDPLLRNFQKTEVYSRVVGYIRPVEQWNKGKREEYNDRKEFVMVKEASC
jgi:ribonucleoside-triphosphate reductase